MDNRENVLVKVLFKNIFQLIISINDLEIASNIDCQEIKIELAEKLKKNLNEKQIECFLDLFKQ